MTLERVDPLAVAEEASQILGEAWGVPALHYTTELMRWQLGFPGLPARAVLAQEGGAPAGFIGATPRRLRFRGAAARGYILSFVGVRPAFQGRGLAGMLYDELFVMLREAGMPVLVFVETHSPPARRALARSIERVGFKSKSLGQYFNHGFMPRRGAATLAATAVEESDPDRVLAAVDACGGDRVLWAAPDRAQIDHYLRDPRSRKIFVIEDGGRVVGAGMAFLSEIVTVQGIDRVPTLDAVFLPAPTADQVAALARAASTAFSGQATSPAVSAPSLMTIQPEVLKAAGLRRTGAAYEGFVVHAEGHPFLEAEVTSSEVV